MTNTAKSKVQQPASFESAMSELEKIVSRLEGGQVPLDDAIKDYTKGLELKQFCLDKLKEVTLKIEKMDK